MNIQELSPKQEPVIYTTIIGLVIAAFASYGFGITDELNELLVYIVPVAIAAFVARQSVTPVPKVAAQKEASYIAGLHDANPNVPPSGRRI